MKSCQAIAAFHYLDDDTIRGWHKTYQDGGRDALSSDGWMGVSPENVVTGGDILRLAQGTLLSLDA